MATAKSWVAKAKINLDLLITGRRDDGYHLLDSLVVFPDIGDEILIAPSDTLSLEIKGPFAEGLSAGEDNLVMRAAQALFSAKCAPVCITLIKNLPVASGIGGGSSDAAATLRALNEYWQLGHSEAALCDIGLELGADVPACVRARSLRLEGIGDKVADCPMATDFWLLLVNPGIAIPTPAVFEKWRQGGGNFVTRKTPLEDIKDLPHLISALQASQNMLQPAAQDICPDVTRVLAELSVQSGCLYAAMSGSGATCFGMFSEEKEMRRAQADLRARFSSWWTAGALVR